MENKNSFIADFMGWPRVENTSHQFQVPGLFPYSDYDGWVIKDPEDMLFHRDWNWLMKTWKILTYRVWQHNKGGYPVEFLNYMELYKRKCCNANLSWAYNVVVEALEWYNSSLK